MLAGEGHWMRGQWRTKPGLTGGMRAGLALLIVLLCGVLGWGATGSDTALLQPTSVAYDAAGNLYFSESRNHVVRRLGVDGTLVTVAGSQVQGFAGDNGDALAAELDTPSGVALDAQGTLYFADTHNNRVRRVDAQTHVITTIAGTGASGFGGDGEAAVKAQLRAPSGLALDGAGHLLVADSGNERVRSIDLAAGVISTVAGNGDQGFSGDGGAATAASLDRPSGLVVDGAGDLFVSDLGNRRVREVRSATRQIVTIAGAAGSISPLRRPEGLSLDASGELLIADAGSHRVYKVNLVTGELQVVAGQGIQAYGGDDGAASLAMLDTPMGVAVGPEGALAISDGGDGRIRLVSPGGVIQTIAGAGGKQAESVQLSGAAVQPYGSATLVGQVTATSVVSGEVRLFATTAVGSQQLAMTPLAGGAAVFDLSGLAVGYYQVYASSSGDATHHGASSPVSSLTIQPLPVSLTATSWSMVYGSAAPAASSQLVGLLPRDETGVSAVVSLPGDAAALSPGAYPIAVALTGAAAGDYFLASGAGQLTVTKAPVKVTLAELSDGLQIRVVSTTTGAPSGAVTLLTSSGGTPASLPLSSGGTATVAFSGLTPGTYQMSAVYTGDADFVGGQSSLVSVTVGGSGASTSGTAADFAMTSVGASTASAPAGESAAFSLQVRPTGAALSGPILLSVSGLPPGATASFSPALVPPGGAASVVALTVQLPQSSARSSSETALGRMVLAAVLGLGLPGMVRRRSRLRLLSIGVAMVMPLALGGCSERIATSASGGTAAPQSYTLVVTGTATQESGAVLQHTMSLTLTVP